MLIRSLVRLSRVDLGFRPERVLALPFNLSSSDDSEIARTRGLLTVLLHNLRDLRGVRSAAVVVSLPLKEGRSMSTSVGLRPKASLSWQVDVNGVSSGYFSTLGIPLLHGRDFTPAETGDDRHPVVILNATAARRLWPGEEAVGKNVALGLMSPASSREVVGVVGDLRTAGPQTPPQPEAYIPYPQVFFGSASLVIHTQGDPLAMAEEVRRQVRGLDEGLVIGNVTTMEQLAANKMASPAANAQILASFAVTGLILAVIGVYGVTSFAVSQKRHELGHPHRLRRPAARGRVEIARAERGLDRPRPPPRAGRRGAAVAPLRQRPLRDQPAGPLDVHHHARAPAGRRPLGGLHAGPQGHANRPHPFSRRRVRIFRIREGSLFRSCGTTIPEAPTFSWGWEGCAQCGHPPRVHAGRRL